MMDRQRWILDNMLMNQFSWNTLNSNELDVAQQDVLQWYVERPGGPDVPADADYQMVMQQAPPMMAQPVYQQPA